MKHPIFKLLHFGCVLILANTLKKVEMTEAFSKSNNGKLKKRKV